MTRRTDILRRLVAITLAVACLSILNHLLVKQRAWAGPGGAISGTEPDNDSFAAVSNRYVSTNLFVATTNALQQQINALAGTNTLAGYVTTNAFSAGTNAVYQAAYAAALAYVTSGNYVVAGSVSFSTISNTTGAYITNLNTLGIVTGDGSFETNRGSIYMTKGSGININTNAPAYSACFNACGTGGTYSVDMVLNNRMGSGGGHSRLFLYTGSATGEPMITWGDTFLNYSMGIDSAGGSHDFDCGSGNGAVPTSGNIFNFGFNGNLGLGGAYQSGVGQKLAGSSAFGTNGCYVAAYISTNGVLGFPTALLAGQSEDKTLAMSGSRSNCVVNIGYANNFPADSYFSAYCPSNGTIVVRRIGIATTGAFTNQFTVQQVIDR